MDQGWHRVQSVDTATRTRHGTCSAPCAVVFCRVLCLTGGTLQCERYVLLLLSWYFIFALGAAEIIKKRFRKRLKFSLKSQGSAWVFFKPGSECNALK